MNDEIESAEKLNGIIEVDETYVGGKGKGKRGGRGSVKKIRYLCLLGVSGLLLWTRLQQRTLKSIIRGNVDKDSIIMTDEFRS